MARMSDMAEKFFADSDPLIVSASASLSPGGSAVLDQGRLANDYDRSRAFLIDTIRFQYSTPVWNAFLRDAATSGANLGGTLRVAFSLGRHQLSRVPIPIALYGPPRDGVVVVDQLGLLRTTYEAAIMSRAGALVTFDGHFEWTLPRPLLVPANMTLEARVVRSDDGFAADLGLDICYLGRLAKKPVPGGIPAAVPYIGLFEQNLVTPGVYVSGQHDLWNPFGRELHVQRFVGRLQQLFRQTPAEQAAEVAAGILFAGTEAITLDYELETFNFVSGEYTGGTIAFPPTQIRRFDGQNMTLGLQPGIAVFDGYRRTFPGGVTLDPRQGFEATVDARSGLPATGSLGANTSFISMIGWREENL